MGQKLLHTIASGSDGVASSPPFGAARVFTDTEDHELVQRRLGLVYQLLAGSVLGMYVAGVIFVGVFWREHFWEVHLSKGKFLHLGVGIVLLVLARILRRGPLRSSTLLSLFDIVGFAKVIAAAG